MKKHIFFGVVVGAVVTTISVLMAESTDGSVIAKELEDEIDILTHKQNKKNES